MIITQGSADPIMTPAVTALTELCEKGEMVEYHVRPGVGHLEAGHVAAPEVATWIADRFAGEPPPSTCDALMTAGARTAGGRRRSQWRGRRILSVSEHRPVIRRP